MKIRDFFNRNRKPNYLSGYERWKDLEDFKIDNMSRYTQSPAISIIAKKLTCDLINAAYEMANILLRNQVPIEQYFSDTDKYIDDIEKITKTFNISILFEDVDYTPKMMEVDKLTIHIVSYVTTFLYYDTEPPEDILGFNFLRLSMMFIESKRNGYDRQ